MSEIRQKRRKTVTSEFRKWEDMEYDCLVNILGKVGLGSLLFDIPFVCKSWYKTSLDPSCWKHVDFSDFFKHSKVRTFEENYWPKFFLIARFISLILHRGLGKTTCLVLPLGSCFLDLERIAEKCPELKSLSLDWDTLIVKSYVPKLMEKWKLLEELRVAIGVIENFQEIIAQIGQNCKNFKSLACSGILLNGDALAIVKHLPKIKKLSLSLCVINDLEMIVLACKELAVLNVEVCWVGGIWEVKKLIEVTAHIKTFNLGACYGYARYLQFLNDSRHRDYDN